MKVKMIVRKQSMAIQRIQERKTGFPSNLISNLWQDRSIEKQFMLP
jgi:hypothetical protein